MLSPLSGDEGLRQIRDLMKMNFRDMPHKGKITQRDILPEFSEHVLSFIDISKIKPFKIVIDAGNGMGGRIIPDVFSKLPCEVIPMYFELDGSFPNHPANPIEPANIRDLQAKVKESGAFLGAAFDGDADRVFLIDENTKPLGGDMITRHGGSQSAQKRTGRYNFI